MDIIFQTLLTETQEEFKKKTKVLRDQIDQMEEELRFEKENSNKQSSEIKVRVYFSKFKTFKIFKNRLSRKSRGNSKT